MSLQADLLHPDLGYFDEDFDLTASGTYSEATAPFGQARKLPAAAYRSKIFSELENEKIWTRGWITVGLLQQIPNPGDMLPFTLGFHGIHIQRNLNGSISARLNRHQHGGCRFVPEQCRTGKQTKCTIASCNYTRDADVMPADENGENTPDMYKFAGINPDKLVPVKCKAWGPFIFINLDSESGVLSDDLGAIAQQIEPWLSKPLHLKASQWLDFKCNWKLIGSAFTDAGQNSNETSDSFVAAQLPHSIENILSSDQSGLDKFNIDIQGTVQIFWVFPNVLLAVCPTYVACFVLQSTGMGNCLCRFTLLSVDENLSADTAGKFKDIWLSFLTTIGERATQQHKAIVNWGTSKQPLTIGEKPPIETSYSTYKLNQFLSSKLLATHKLYWNPTIMDAKMTQRG